MVFFTIRLSRLSLGLMLRICKSIELMLCCNVLMMMMKMMKKIVMLLKNNV